MDLLVLGGTREGVRFDAVLDTWSAAPAVVQLAARALVGKVGSFGYVSSISGYGDGRPPGGNESWPAVEADPGAGQTNYAADKRGGELAALESFPDALIGRPGLILGPWENVGRLPWWLDRASRGGRMVAPGRRDRPLQYVDVRDLATWFLDGVESGLGGEIDLVCPSGHLTTGTLLDAVVTATGSTAELVWFDQEALERAGAQPWSELPGWVPEGGEFDGFMESDTSKAIATGLRSRSIGETVTDTWAWFEADGLPGGFRGHGLPQATEERLLASVS